MKQEMYGYSGLTIDSSKVWNDLRTHLQMGDQHETATRAGKTCNTQIQYWFCIKNNKIIQ